MSQNFSANYTHMQDYALLYSPYIAHRCILCTK